MTGIGDNKYQWHRTEEYGLPWESGSYLLSLMGDPWRIHLAASELAGSEVLVLASHYSSRELEMERHDEAIGMDDLDAFLRFKPWRSAENRLKYPDNQISELDLCKITARDVDFLL